MNCRKCGKDLPDGAVYCAFCGIKQVLPKQKPKRRGNGQGTAIKRGRSWTGIFRRMYNGEMVTITKGGFATKNEALEWVTTVPKVRRVRSDISFAALYDQWLARHRERVTASTIACYTSAYKYFDRVYFVPFADLTTEQLQECVDNCPHGVRTRENMKALCTLLYKYAHEIGVTSEDYGQHIYIKRTGETSEKRAFTAKELRDLIAAADTVPYIDLVLIMCYTGYRVNEIVKMPRSAYDPESLTLVGGSKTAAGMNRLVPVAEIIRPYVDRYYRTATEDGLLFHDEHGRRLTTNRVRDLQAEALREVPSVRQLTPHECRHTFATLLKRTTGSKEDKKRLIGHSSDEMLEHYTHSEIAELRSIIDQF